MNANLQTAVFSPHYFLGDHMLVIGTSNEIAFLENDQINYRQRLEPRVMAVLQVLLQTPKQVVTKEHLIQTVWGDYNGEESLMQAISKLRRVFQDDAKKPKYIETIPKKGYRLIAPVINVSQKMQEQRPQNYSTPSSLIIQQTGLFTGFIERLSKPKFLFSFLLFSIILIMVLGILSQVLFWGAVAVGLI